MPMPSSQLYDACAATLAAVVAHYSTLGVELPARRYVNSGEPAWDCDQVVVYPETTVPGLSTTITNEPLRPCTYFRTATLYIEIARCVPVESGNGRPPTVDRLDEAARRLLADPVDVANGILAANRSGTLGGFDGISLGSWDALGPQGGFGGGRQTIQFQLTEV